MAAYFFFFFFFIFLSSFLLQCEFNINIYFLVFSETTVAIIVLSSLVLLLIAVGGILCFLMKKNLRDSHQYSPVPMEMT